MTWLVWLWRRGNRVQRWARLKGAAPPPIAGAPRPQPTVERQIKDDEPLAPKTPIPGPPAVETESS